MIYPLLVASKQNAHILRKICTELDTCPPREQIGDDWSLKLFLQSDVKNYNERTHFVLDVNAFKEKNEDFLALIEGITYQTDASIIIYADTNYAGDDFLDKLVQKGFTNIVANYDTKDEKKNIELMFEDLRECLSPDGLSQKKWRRYDKHYKPIQEIKPEPQIKLQEYSRAKMRIAVVGCQSRIGTTSYAVQLCDYISRRNGKVAYVCAYSDGDLQLEMMKEILEACDNGDHFELAGIDFFPSASAVPNEYNAVVYDCGSVGKNSYLSVCENADCVYLVGGTSWSELPAVVSAQEPLADINYTLIANFSSTAECEKYNELLSCNLNNVIAAPYAPKLFVGNAYDSIFDKEFERFCDKEQGIDDDEESAEAV